MTHELTHNPIKLRIVDIKTGEWIKSCIFVGTVPKDVQRQLEAVEKLFNDDKKITNNKVLKKFYGNNWMIKLGLHKKDELPVEGSADSNLETTIEGGDDSDTDSVYYIGGDTEEQFDENTFVIDDDFDQSNVTLDEADFSELLPAPEKKEVEVVNTVDNTTKEKIYKRGSIEFVTELNVYPIDNILEFKRKVAYYTKIPIYRQHLWYKHKGKSYPAQYVLNLNGAPVNVDIERLISHYTGTNKMDVIEDIPVNLNYYKNKDFIHVSALDTFTLLLNNLEKYGVTEYFITDLNYILDTDESFRKILKDSYQTEVIYYGFIMIYFPMITNLVFIDYLKNESNIVDVYPELSISKSDMKTKLEREAIIVQEAYDSTEQEKQLSKKLFSSVISTIVSINDYSQSIDSVLILRNLFDLFELNEYIPYCKAHLLYENRVITLKKAYHNELEVKENIPLNSLLIKIRINQDTTEHIRLIIFKNGNFIIRTSWREEAHMSFEKITKVVMDKVNPIIQKINKMDNRIKHYDVKMHLVSKQNIQFTESAFSFYYEDDITESKYGVFKSILDEYQKAGIIQSKDVISMGYEYFFRKGMYCFDAARLEKSITTQNYYDFLSNGVVQQKWITIFERTRLFQIINVASKLKVLVSGMRDDLEIHIFQMFLLAMIQIFQRTTSDKGKSIISSVTKKSLKNLKQQDPMLYDFKKLYRSPVVYSKICQKPHQPTILSEEEYQKLDSERKKSTIKYWNFTKEKPAWYTCPNPKYPFIKFITGYHPRNFCIPCCKKVEMSDKVNKIKQNVHKICMQNHTYTGEKVILTKASHYIATYGKDIEVGRICRLPENTLEPLFFDTYSPDGGIDQECIKSEGYYLFGVDQHLPSLSYIGLLYCVVHSLNLSVDAFLKQCGERIKKQPDKFRILLDGNASMYFADYRELLDVVYLLEDNTILKNKYSSVPWNDLFKSIVYYYFGVNCIMFEDQQKERIDMILPKNLKTYSEMFPSTHKNLVILKRKQKFYPVYLLNTEVFKRTGAIEERLFHNESGIVTTVQAVVRKHFEQQTYDKIKPFIDLSIVKDFIKTTKVGEITHYFINYTNLCYAILVKFENTFVYFPVAASHYSIESKIKLIFDSYKLDLSANVSVSMKLFKLYNKWVSAVSYKEKLESLSIYPLIEPVNWIALRNSNVIGFICNSMHFYVKPISVNKAVEIHKCEIQYLLYDPNYINEIIHKVKLHQLQIGNCKEVEIKLQRSMMKHHTYQLVMLQLINIFNQQRNNNLRKKIVLQIGQTNFDRNTTKLRDFIKENIVDEDDAIKLKNIISKYVTVHHDKSRMFEEIKNTYFSFDRLLLNELINKPHDVVYKELCKILTPYIKTGEVDLVEFPNILTLCDSSNSTYCKGGKLVLPKEHYETIIDVIANDINNEYKIRWMFNSAFVQRSVLFFKFIKRPAESITVEFNN
jgi:hypothetical protein